MSSRVHMGSIIVAVVLLLALTPTPSRAAEDPLPSWKDGAAKQSILDFVGRVTKEDGPDYVAPAERVATFDNDGTLWSEKPLYFQLQFALDRVRALASEHPEWKDTEPFRSVLAGDREAIAKAGMEGVLALVSATHADVTTEEFARIAKEWLATAKHPRFGRLYQELTYLPMRELLDYLRANDFDVWICSGGGIDFLRAFAEEAYGVPPDRVIGSRTKAHFEFRAGRPVLVKDPGVGRVNDKDTKPVGIQLHVGRRPILAGGNSDGDHEMLQFTDDGEGPALNLLVHHDDAEREWAYDKDSHVGRLDKALVEARTRGWTVVSMKKDWRRIYAFEGEED